MEKRRKRRIVWKLSGEALSGIGRKGHFRDAYEHVCREARSVSRDVELAIVLGGGNINRGSEIIAKLKLPRRDEVAAHWAGMLHTYINGMLLQTVMRRDFKLATRLMLARPYPEIGEPFVRDRALHHLERGRIVILAGGTGNPGASTDSGAVLRAYELGADMVLKGTKVDGVYDRDPREKGAVLLPKLTSTEFRRRKLERIFDGPAVESALGFHLPIRVYDAFTPGNLRRALAGRVGSIILPAASE